MDKSDLTFQYAIGDLVVFNNGQRGLIQEVGIYVNQYFCIVLDHRLCPAYKSDWYCTTYKLNNDGLYIVETSTLPEEITAALVNYLDKAYEDLDRVKEYYLETYRHRISELKPIEDRLTAAVTKLQSENANLKYDIVQLDSLKSYCEDMDDSKTDDGSQVWNLDSMALSDALHLMRERLKTIEKALTIYEERRKPDA